MKNKLIFSVYQQMPQDYANHVNVLADMKDFNAKEVNGMYAGVKEKSIMVDYTTVSAFAALGVARQFNQESILEIDDEGAARLYLLQNDDYVELGQMVEVTPTDDLNAYSEVDGKFYVAKGE